MKQKSPALGETPGARVAYRVAQLRRKHHWSLDRLALASGVSRSMLSQIERNETNPTLAVTDAIARAFGLSLSELVDEPSSGRQMYLTSRVDTTTILRKEPGYRIRALTPLRYAGTLAVYELLLAPSGEFRSAPHVMGTREVAIVVTGRVDVVSGTQNAVLEKGDALTFHGDVDYRISNLEDEQAELVLIEYYHPS
jgi:transcriptional regulator with XRE-family HTH domain